MRIDGLLGNLIGEKVEKIFVDEFCFVKWFWVRLYCRFIWCKFFNVLVKSFCFFVLRCFISDLFFLVRVDGVFFWSFVVEVWRLFMNLFRRWLIVEVFVIVVLICFMIFIVWGMLLICLWFFSYFGIEVLSILIVLSGVIIVLGCWVGCEDVSCLIFGSFCLMMVFIFCLRIVWNFWISWNSFWWDFWVFFLRVLMFVFF